MTGIGIILSEIIDKRVFNNKLQFAIDKTAKNLIYYNIVFVVKIVKQQLYLI